MVENVELSEPVTFNERDLEDGDHDAKNVKGTAKTCIMTMNNKKKIYS